MPKPAVVVGWLVAAPATLLVSMLLLHQVATTQNFSQAAVSSISVLSQTPPYQLFAAIPEQIGGLKSAVETGDARSLILENFFKANNSPLAAYTQLLVETADKYNLDFRLIPSIAMVESTGGKVIPPGSFNAWGFENGATKFASWEHAIEKVAKTLRENYIDEGLVTPEQIMPKYAPPSVAKGGPWAKGVNFFFEKLE